MFNQLLSLHIMGLLLPKLFYASYQFISSPVSTVLVHFKRGFHKKGEQVCVKTEFDFGLRVANVTMVLRILVYTRVLTRKEMKHLRLSLLG